MKHELGLINLDLAHHISDQDNGIEYNVGY